jgi:hypothetical protein
MRLKLIIEPPPPDPPRKVYSGWINGPESRIRIVDARTGEPLDGVISFRLISNPNDIVRFQVEIAEMEVDAEIDCDVVVNRNSAEPHGIGPDPSLPDPRLGEPNFL